MHIHINLFEEKEEPNRLAFILLGVGTFLLLLLFSIFLWERSVLIDERSRLLQELSRYDIQQQTLQDRTQAEGIKDQLELWQTLETLKAASIPVDDLVESFVEQLPERGFIQSFLYSPDGSVTLDVRFDSLQGAARYTDALTSLSIVSAVHLEEVVALEGSENSSSLEVLPRYSTTYIVDLVDASDEVEGQVNET